MLLISQILVLIASGLLAVLAKTKADKSGDYSVEYLVIALAALASTLAALGSLLLDKTGPDSGTLLRMLQNLAFYAATPMLVTALIALARNYPISRPAWGRWLLGLIALYELLRRMGYGEQYTLILAIVSVAAFALSLIWFTGSKLKLSMTLSMLLFAAAVAAYQFATLTLALLVCSAGILVLAASIRLIPDTRKNS